jgi:predicted ATPase
MTRKADRTSPGPYLLRVEVRRDPKAKADAYPYTIPAIRSLAEKETLEIHPKVTFLVGENGSGKSTLLEAVAVALRLNPEGGSQNFKFSTRRSHSQLHKDLTLILRAGLPEQRFFLRAESFFNVATQVERYGVVGSYGGRSLHEQSHGESFFALFRNRFGPHGLYVLDEPEAALSPQRQLEFLALLHDYAKRGAQFLIATHSPIIMAYPDARIYTLGDGGLRETAYEDTEHFRITRNFLLAPAKSLAILMSEDSPQRPTGSPGEED